MIGLGIGPPFARARRGGSAALPLLAPGTVMVVMGDSLAAQARDEYQHPLFWAASMGQRLDFHYRGDLHNIGIGTSGLDEEATLIAGLAPYNTPTPRGLLHPDRLAREIGIVTAVGAKVVLTDIDTNTALGYSHAQQIARRQQLDQALFNAGVERIIHGVLAPKHNLSGAQAATFRARNAALYDYVASDPRLFVYDGHESELDPVLGASNYAPIGGNANTVAGASTMDGTHWSAAHGVRRATALRAVLEQIFPLKALPAYSLTDVYSYAGARYVNALGAYAGFGGTSDALPSGATGLEPQRWDVLGSGFPPEINLVIQNDVDVEYGGAVRKGCRVKWNGTPSTSGSVSFQCKHFPPAGTDADNKLRLHGSEKIKNIFVLEFDDFAGCTGIKFNGARAIGAGGAGNAGGWVLPALNGRYIWSEQTGRPVVSGSGFVFLFGGFSFTAGVPVSGSVTLVYAEFGHEA
jgi:hypothetical protein